MTKKIADAAQTRLDTGVRGGYRKEDIDHFGLCGAIILSQLHFLLNSQSVHGDRKNKYNGDWWVTKTYREWRRDAFHWWSQKTIERAFRDLEEVGVIKARKVYDLIDPDGLSSNTKIVKSYTIDYERHESICTSGSQVAANGAKATRERQNVLSLENSEEIDINTANAGQNVPSIQGQNVSPIQGQNVPPYIETECPAERSVLQTSTKTTAEESKQKNTEGAERLNARARVPYDSFSDSESSEAFESIVQNLGIQDDEGMQRVVQKVVRHTVRKEVLKDSGLTISQYVCFALTDPYETSEWEKENYELSDADCDALNEYKRSIPQREYPADMIQGGVPY